MHDNRNQAVRLGVLICEQLQNGELLEDSAAIKAASDKHMMKKTAKRPAGHEEMTAKRPAGHDTKKEETKGTEAGRGKHVMKKPATKGQEADEEEEEEEEAQEEEEEDEEAQEEEEEEEEEEEADEAEVKKKPAQQTKPPAGKGKPLPVHKKPAGHPPAKKQKQQSDAENVNYAMELARRELDDDLPPSQLLDFGDLRDDGSRPTEAAPQR